MYESSEPTVPVFIDSVKRMDDFECTRCIYYRLEFTHEPPTWPPSAPADGTYAVANLGGWAVLCGPGGAERFDSSIDIEATLDELAGDDDISFDLGYCWLPNAALEAADPDGTVRAGDVLRLPAPLFRLCCRHAAGQVGDEPWRAGFATSEPVVELSVSETEAFRAWRRTRIDKTRQRYRAEDYAKHRLPQREVSK